MGKIKFILLVCFLTLSASCGKNNDITLTAEQSMAKQLELNTWKIVSVKVDGTDQTGLFNGFTIKFNASSYTTTGMTPVWARSGTWQFLVNSNAQVFTRDDGTNVTIENITDSSLVLSLTWNDASFGGGRFNSVVGKHIFTFNK